MLDKDYVEFTIGGVIQLHEYDTLKRMGYKTSQYEIFDSNVIYYVRSSQLDGALFGKTKSDTLMYIIPEMIKTVYTLQEGKEKFPELFL